MKKTQSTLFLIIAISFAATLIFQANPLKAQADASLMFLPIVPHGRNVNPASIPSYRFYVGIPLVSSVKTGFQNSINYEDIFQRKGDSLILDRDYILDNLDDESKINFNLLEEYFSFGFRVQKNYFHFRVADIVQSNIVIKKQLLTFLLYGNGSPEYLGKNVNVGGDIFSASYYREYSFGYARQINEKLNVGVNLKYLQGIANITTESSDFEIMTDADDFAITVKSNIEINMSSPGIDNKAAKVEDFLPNPHNGGFAFDIGGDYKINEDFEAFASVLNLGSIKWTENVKNFKTENPDEAFVFEGIDINDYFEDNEFDNNAIGDVLDSIADEIGVNETAETYKSRLAPILNIGGRYNLTEKDMFSLLFRNQFLQNSSWTTTSIAYTRKFSKSINLMVSNTFYPQSYFNPGIGFAANIGPVQLYLLNENIIAPFKLNSSNVFVVRFGVNLIFNDKRKDSNGEIPI